MISKSEQDLFQKYLDGELEGDQEKKALRMIADHPEMRELLQFERTVLQTFNNNPTPDSFSVPDGFSENVMSELSGDKIKSSKKNAGSIFRPVQYSIRPVYAFAAVLLLAFSFGFLLLDRESSPEVAQADQLESSVQMVSETESEVWVRFVYFDDDADVIAVAGDFNDWKPIELSKENIDGRQVWTGLIPISRGEHQYMFVRDENEWVTDPLADIRRDDGFGNENAVLYL